MVSRASKLLIFLAFRRVSFYIPKFQFWTPNGFFDEQAFIHPLCYSFAFHKRADSFNDWSNPWLGRISECHPLRFCISHIDHLLFIFIALLLVHIAMYAMSQAKAWVLCMCFTGLVIQYTTHISILALFVSCSTCNGLEVSQWTLDWPQQLFL